MRFARSSLLILFAVFFVACSESGPRSDAWTADLPAPETPVAPGARAWAAVPLTNPGNPAEVAAVRFGVFTVVEPAETVPKGSLALVDGLGVAHVVPAALVHSIAESPDLEIGTLALGLHRTAGVALGRLASTAPPILAFHWNGAPIREAVDAVRAVRGEIAPLEPIVFRDDSGWSRGIVVALAGDRAWIADEIGRIFVRPLTEVRAPSGLGEERAAGDAVLAYSWAEGIEKGTVEAGPIDVEAHADADVEATGYRVRLDSGAVQIYSREALADDSPLPSPGEAAG